MSQDPLGLDAGTSILYRYVNNRPTVSTDPSGEFRRRLFPIFPIFGRNGNCPPPSFMPPCPVPEPPEIGAERSQADLGVVRESNYPPQEKNGPVSKMYVFAVEGFGGLTVSKPLHQDQRIGKMVIDSAEGAHIAWKYSWIP